MLIGRFFGSFVAAFLGAEFLSNNLVGTLALCLAFAVAGTLFGLLISFIFGDKTKTDRPLDQDSLKYWTDKYGEGLGSTAYKYWLEELDEEGTDTTP